MCSPYLAVEGIKLIFSHNGRIPVLDELNINVRKGYIYGLLGPSGCGKTTLLRCILGRLQPQSGEIRIYGRKPGETGFCIPGRGVGYMPQELALYSEITVEENLQYFGRLFGMSNDEITERISFLVDLLKVPDKKSVIKNLSGGQMRRVSFATALIHKPPLLILDEPTVGVDPVLRRNIWAHLKTLAIDDHITIIITTHYVEETCNADMIGLMRKGYLLAEENPAKLLELHGLNSLEEVFLKLSSGNDLHLQKPVSIEIQETMVDSPINNSCISLSASVEMPYSDLSSAINSVKLGKTWGVLCIEQNFTSSLLERFLKCGSVDNGTIWGSSVKLYLDMTNQQISFTLQHAIFTSFQDFSEEMLIANSQNPLLAAFPIVVENPIYGSKDAAFAEFGAPNLFLAINYFVATALTAMRIVVEKRQGLLECSMIAGVQCAEILFAILLTMFMVMFVQIILVFVVVLTIFEIPVHGSVIMAFVCMLITGIGGLSLGLLISAISKDESVVALLLTASCTPMLLLSGLVWPTEAMPLYLKYISYCLPMTLLSNTMRSVLSRGWSVTDNNIWIGLVISLTWIVLFLLLAGLLFKRKR